MNQRRRRGLTLVELLVVSAMLGVLLALLLPAVQKVRQASKREACAEKLMQIGLALYSYHDANGYLPPGIDGTPAPSFGGTNYYWAWSWMGRLLPYVGQEDLWQQADNYARTVSDDPWSGSLPGQPIGNPALRTPVPVWRCPADDRVLVATFHSGSTDLTVALTDYQGVSGVHSFNPGGTRSPVWNEGVLHAYLPGHSYDSTLTSFSDITNGLSNVLMVGGRPPTGDLIFGWWFAGAGEPNFQNALSGAADVVLGVSERNTVYSECPQGVDNQFMPGDLDNLCDQFHYWSLHHHGANFLLADGSAHFFKYTIDPAVLIAMAYRSGGPP